MDIYQTIEVEIAKKYNAVAKGTKKSIGDFLLENNINKPVNVKSNNIHKKNYSPNIISAKRLIEWLKGDDHELFFIFVDYEIDDKGLKIIKDSGLIPIQHINWNCLTIEAQGWGVIQMCKPLEINKEQSLNGFLKGMKIAYEKYLNKEAKKVEVIRKMIENF
ncbi:hypothetical protein [Chryseobacterium sp.]|uniref:hypothetical protein n=1 Tax=Chryseobacterium sp. TaxID=1871047 RepID=UPI003219AB44